MPEHMKKDRLFQKWSLLEVMSCSRNLFAISVRQKPLQQKSLDSVHTHVHTSTQVYIYIYIHIYTGIHLYTQVYTYISTKTSEGWVRCENTDSDHRLRFVTLRLVLGSLGLHCLPWQVTQTLKRVVFFSLQTPGNI